MEKCDCQRDRHFDTPPVYHPYGKKFPLSRLQRVATFPRSGSPVRHCRDCVKHCSDAAMIAHLVKTGRIHA